MICRWAHELLGYQFSVIHHHKHMMADVDSLTKRFGPLVATHCCVAAIIYTRDTSLRPFAYEHSTFKDHTTAQLTPPSINYPCQPILSSKKS